MRTVRHARRSLLRTPGYVAVVVTTLAVAIGANAAIFALVREALLRPLPFRDTGRRVPSMLVVAAGLAAWLPARPAARVDPAAVLRGE